MAGSSILYMLSFLILLPYGSMGATLYSDSHNVRRKIVRSESVEMNARGDIKNMPSKSKPSDDEDESEESIEFCNYDFVLGNDGTDDCSHQSHHKIAAGSPLEALINQSSLCIEAAMRAKVSAPHASFVLDAEWQNVRPKGCFKYHCSEDPNNVCYFYNPISDSPSGAVSGTPVCARTTYIEGARNSNGGETGDCLVAGSDGTLTKVEGYEVIDNDFACENTAKCLGHTKGAEFRIGIQNASKHLLYPRGCFQRNSDDKIYYNGPSALTNGKPAATNVRGTPLCVVAGGGYWHTSWDAKKKKLQTEEAAKGNATSEGAKSNATSEAATSDAASEAATTNATNTTG